MAYRCTFAVDSIGRDDPRSLELAKAHMQALLDCLTAINRAYLQTRAYPDLYAAGIRYHEDNPAPGSTCGDDDWCDIETVYRRRVGDCDDLACIRAAQLQAQGIPVRAIPLLRRRGGQHEYHIVVAWPSGRSTYPRTVFRDPSGSGLLIEDPSAVLGMR